MVAFWIIVAWAVWSTYCWWKWEIRAIRFAKIIHTERREHDTEIKKILGVDYD